ncbi:DUF692 domain-containing protein [Dongia sp.]|uniref:MNIO family bufferin maturase n=1 Tax=Dongia sp. TaxID=1977262 RepID=UPI0035B3049C
MPAGLQAQAGIGLRPQHYNDALANPRDVAFVEVHPENYLCAGGPQHHYLTLVREILPVSFHGVGLSLGGETRPDRTHLERLRGLIDRYQPFRFSEHLAWSSHGGHFFNDLLPLPYTQRNLARMVDHVVETQEALGRQILIENPSLYLGFAESEMSEPEFLAQLAACSGCALLLDINNLYVSAINAGTDPWASLAAFPLWQVGEIHLAGHARQVDADGDVLLIDAHNAPVADAVWQLFAEAVAVMPPVPVLIEWDNDLPAWAELTAEAHSAQSILDLSQPGGRLAAIA